MAQTVHNNTTFTEAEIEQFKYLGVTVNNWRQRNIVLCQHPTDPERVISIGETFDETMKVIADEPKSDWRTALDYAAMGKVYTSD